MAGPRGNTEIITRAVSTCFCAGSVCLMVYLNSNTFDTEAYVCAGSIVVIALAQLAPEILKKIVEAVINRLPGWKK